MAQKVLTQPYPALTRLRRFTQNRFGFQFRAEAFPWWFVGILVLTIWLVYAVTTQETYRAAFVFIQAGLETTLSTTFWAFGVAVVIGLFTGLGRISQNTLAKNLATFYVEMVRGIPMLVLIFFIALVGVPAVVEGIVALGGWLVAHNMTALGQQLAAFDIKNISMSLRAIIAMAVTYGAFLAEIFRAGIQSIGRGQMEAARSQGMSYFQAMRYVILPQAVRNVLPAIGNDFISMLKDSSLVSVLAIRDITQVARLYAGQTFQFREAYTILAIFYLSMTLVLSLLVKALEKRLHQDERS